MRTIHVVSDGQDGCRVTLVCARSSRVTGNRIPKVELKVCWMVAVLSARLLSAFGEQVTSWFFVTNSLISLCWISSDERPLETMVHNTVIEICRFSSPHDWYHVETHKNIADLGTRYTTVDELQPGSEW